MDLADEFFPFLSFEFASKAAVALRFLAGCCASPSSSLASVEAGIFRFLPDDSDGFDVVSSLAFGAAGFGVAAVLRRGRELLAVG